MKLTKFLERYPQFRKYYEFLKPYLPPIEKIKVYDLTKAIDYGVHLRATVFGCSIPPDLVFFKNIPPNERTFVHELIHLCKKPGDVEEETYAYNLVDAVIFCVNQGIKGNPFKLFSLTKAQIVDVLKKFGFESLEEFYAVMGIIPHIYKIEAGEMVLENGVSEKDEVVVFITEVVSGLAYESLSRRIFTALMELCKE